MAAVVVNSMRNTVFGNKRAILANVNVATSGDTWVTPLTSIQMCLTEPSSAITHGATHSGGTVTFLNAADTSVDVLVIGI